LLSLLPVAKLEHKQELLQGELAALLLFSGGAWAHEGEHEGKSNKAGHSRFEEGSGSSVIDSKAPGQEYSEKGEAYREGHGKASEASTGEEGMGAPKKGNPAYEEGSRGMSGEQGQQKDHSRRGQVN